MSSLLIALLALAPLFSQEADPPPVESPPEVEADDGGSGTEPPRDLLRIAELEAARRSALLRDQITALLGGVAAERDPRDPAVQAAIGQVTRLGPDAAPILLEILHSVDQQGLRADHVVRCALGLYSATQDDAILRALCQMAQDPKAPARFATLMSFRTIDHPLVAETLVTLLRAEEPVIVRGAVRALARQRKSVGESVLGLLRRMLEVPRPDESGQLQESDLLPDVISTLHQLGDDASEEPVVAILLKTVNPATIDAGLDYLKAHGGQPTFPALRRLLFQLGAEANGPIDRDLRARILAAAQQIGLEGAGTRALAEQFLTDAYRKLGDLWSRWRAARLLGPYQNAGAYDYLAEPLEGQVEANPTNVDLYLKLTEVQLLFEKWKRAQTTLNRAEGFDRRGAQAAELAFYRGIAFCGLGKFREAEREFRKFNARLGGFVDDWPVLEKMQGNARYEDLFR